MNHTGGVTITLRRAKAYCDRQRKESRISWIRLAAIVVLSGRVMFSRIAISVVLASALLLSGARLPAASCILSNAPSEKACTMTCCANQTCCETSHQRTGPPVQPLAKATSDQPNIATLCSTVVAVVFNQAAADSFVFSSAECSAHSPPPLALICIRLI